MSLETLTFKEEIMNKKDYSKVSKSQKTSKAKKEEVVEEIKEAAPIVKEGVVNCDKLNVRMNPEKDANVLLIINKDDKVTILEESNEVFYKVKLANNTEGYCMKKFIDIK